MFGKKKPVRNVNDVITSIADLIGDLNVVAANQTNQEEIHTAIASKAEDAALRAAQEALRADKIATKLTDLIT